MAELALGTVQLGLPYGAANVTGMPTEEEAVAIVREAVAGGVRELDTAHGYDLSQQRLGVAMLALAAEGLPTPRVVTKLDVAVQDAASADEVASIVDASVANSREKLGLDPLHTVCLHQWAKHGPSLHGGAAYTRLKELKAKGAIERIGTSTYNPSDVLEALADPATEHIQLPFNFLDYRWREAGVPEALAARPDVTVHARSCFLQGILVSPKTDPWPSRFGRELAKKYVDAIGGLVAALGRKNRVDLCLAYARAQPWVTSVLVGAETVQQVRELLDLRSQPPLTAAEVAQVDAALPRAPLELLNPGLWHDKPSFAGSYATGLLGPEEAGDTK